MQQMLEKIAIKAMTPLPSDLKLSVKMRMSDRVPDLMSSWLFDKKFPCKLTPNTVTARATFTV